MRLRRIVGDPGLARLTARGKAECLPSKGPPHALSADRRLSSPVFGPRRVFGSIDTGDCAPKAHRWRSGAGAPDGAREGRMPSLQGPSSRSECRQTLVLARLRTSKGFRFDRHGRPQGSPLGGKAFCLPYAPKAHRWRSGAGAPSGAREGRMPSLQGPSSRSKCRRTLVPARLRTLEGFSVQSTRATARVAPWREGILPSLCAEGASLAIRGRRA